MWGGGGGVCDAWVVVVRVCDAWVVVVLVGRVCECVSVWVCGCVCVCVRVCVGDGCGCVGGYWGVRKDASVCVGVVGVEGGIGSVGDTTHDAW